jgi:hypothetical protein
MCSCPPLFHRDTHTGSDLLIVYDKTIDQFLSKCYKECSCCLKMPRNCSMIYLHGIKVQTIERSFARDCMWYSYEVEHYSWIRPVQCRMMRIFLISELIVHNYCHLNMPWITALFEYTGKNNRNWQCVMYRYHLSLYCTNYIWDSTLQLKLGCFCYLLGWIVQGRRNCLTLMIWRSVKISHPGWWPYLNLC